MRKVLSVLSVLLIGAGLAQAKDIEAGKIEVSGMSGGSLLMLSIEPEDGGSMDLSLIQAPHSAHRSPDIRTSQELVRWSLNLLLSQDPPCSFLVPTCQKGQDLPLVLDGADHLFSLLRGEQVVA
jgi:hypothetical protein